MPAAVHDLQTKPATSLEIAMKTELPVGQALRSKPDMI